MLFGSFFAISLLISLGLAYSLMRVRKNPTAKIMLVMVLLDAFWISMEGLPFFLADIQAGTTMQMLKYIGIVFIPPVFLILVNEYTGVKTNFLNTPLIFFVPVLSIISVATNRFPYPFFSSAVLTYISGLPVFLTTRDIGFWVHTVYSYALILVCCLSLLRYAFRAPRLYRLQSIVIFAGTILSFALNIVVVNLELPEGVIDATPISIMLTTIIFYYGLFRMPKSVIKPFARELLIENLVDLVIIVDNDNRIVDINPAAVNFFISNGGPDARNNFKTASDFSGLMISDLKHYFPGMELITNENDAGREATLLIKNDRKIEYFQIATSPIRDYDQALIGKLHMLHNVTAQQDYLLNLKKLNEKLALSGRILHHALEGIAVTDRSNTITWVNPSLERMTGYQAEELLGQNPRIFKSGYHEQQYYEDMWCDLRERGYWEGEIWNRDKNGELFPNWMSITSLKNETGEVDNYIAVSTDISKIKKTEDALYNLSNYDPLTGLVNRSLFYESLKWALGRRKQNENVVALLFADLDEFKVINDSLGHAVGDMILKETANRIRSRLRETDTLARFGGDDFAIILEDLQAGEDARMVAEALIDEVRRPFIVVDREVILRLNIGVALAPEDENTVDGLVRKAEAAMFDVISGGGGTYSFSSEAIDKKNHEALEMQVRLSRALANREFNLHLQPLISLVDGRFRMVGAESLIRWRTLEGVIYTPDKFIPFSERMGTIIPIGNWAMEEIFRIDRVLKKEGFDIELGINVSSKQFDNPAFVPHIRQLLQDNRELNTRLVIEITESLLLNDFEKAVRDIQSLKELGIKIALDDFGTGYSSLSYLARLPIDYLKIDKSFIGDLLDTQKNHLTSSIIAMARNMHLKTVAEGVETREQVQMLVNENCDKLQGYYFSKPLDLERFMEFAAREREIGGISDPEAS
jgi:diguanylate cyclase (GGDEF)-like protein/PAS domain S-box-containing protein